MGWGSDTPEIKNALIKSTFLGIEDHGIFTAFITLDYSGSGQSFGGYSMDAPNKGEQGLSRIGTPFGCEFILRVIRTLEVNSWEKLIGTYCRVMATHNKVHSIGHIQKDQWFSPEELAKEFETHGL